VKKYAINEMDMKEKDLTPDAIKEIIESGIKHYGSKREFNNALRRQYSEPTIPDVVGTATGLSRQQRQTMDRKFKDDYEIIKTKDSFVLIQTPNGDRFRIEKDGKWSKTVSSGIEKKREGSVGSQKGKIRFSDLSTGQRVRLEGRPGVWKYQGNFGGDHRFKKFPYPAGPIGHEKNNLILRGGSAKMKIVSWEE